MTRETPDSEHLARLRERAEAAMERETADAADVASEDLPRLVHELRTHRIELEMQNEELRSAEKELVDSRDQYADLYDQAPVGYLTVSEKGIIVQANLTVAEMLGVDRAHLIRTPLSAFVTADHQDVYYLHRRQLLESRQRRTCELRMHRADQTPFWAAMDSAVTEVPDAAGGLHIRSVLIDVSRRKRAEQELLRAKVAAEAASRAKSAFLGNVSHEIRTPLAVIMSFVDLLTFHELPPDQWREHLQTIHGSAEHLLCIINDILDLSKIEAVGIELKRTDCALREIVEEVRALMQVRASEKQLTLDVNYALPLPATIRTDRIRLKQILINLLSNAIKFTQEGGAKLTVRCVEPDGSAPRLQFAVADTGIGMSAQQVKDVFEPFIQADMSDTRTFGGTGLGLSISQKFAKLLGGEIEVQSRPGTGSTFTLTVDPGPLAQAADFPAGPATPEEQGPPVPVPPPQLRGRVLLADDVPEIQTSLRLMFESLRLELDLAANGRTAEEQALASRARGRPYDLILMDIQMPGVNGYEATRRLRHAGWEGPIVALTAHAMVGEGDKCLVAGFTEVLVKPFRRDQLLAVLAKHLDHAAPR